MDQRRRKLLLEKIYKLAHGGLDFWETKKGREVRRKIDSMDFKEFSSCPECGNPSINAGYEYHDGVVSYVAYCDRECDWSYTQQLMRVE